MKYLLPFLFISFSLHSWSQRSVAEKDSLVSALQNLDERSRLYEMIKLVVNSNAETEKDYWRNRSLYLIEKRKDDTARSHLKFLEGRHRLNFGDKEKGMQLLLDAIAISEGLQDSAQLANYYYTLGIHYSYSEEWDYSSKYFRKCLAIYPSTGNRLAYSQIVMVNGIILKKKGDFEESLYMQEMALNIKREGGFLESIPESLNNLAELNYEMRNYEEYYKMIERSLHLSDSLKLNNAYFGALTIKSGILQSQNKYNEAIPLMESVVHYHETEGWRKNLLSAYKTMADIYEGAGQEDKAYSALKSLIEMKDSIFYSQQAEAAKDVEAKYESEKKDLQLAKERSEKEFAQKESQLTKDRESERTTVTVIIGIIMLFNIIYFYLRYKKQRKDAQLISTQKNEIEIQHQEIKSSIEYAKRIQTAILPPPKLVKEHLNNSFVIYKPKDVVAGDFYWMEAKSEGILFATADCTGHGVPGAMVSVICNNGLNRSVREFGLSDPGKILDKTRDIVLQEFEKSEEEVKDGMDIALCSLEGMKLKYAGAHNPLWIIRKGLSEVEEIKADKQPIGNYTQSKPFTTHEVTLNPGDTFYTFSDGFADQFGGGQGKKFKAKNFKTLLISIQNESMVRQKELLDEAFENWRGGLEQLDDVCVLGVRV